MSSLHDAIARSAEAGGAEIGARLRAPGAAESLASRARARRRRSATATALASAACLALVVVVGADLLRPPPDPAGPVHRGDVAPIDRGISPDAAGMFVCGAVPEGVPERGVTIPVEADEGAHPTVEVGLFTRYLAADGEAVAEPVQLDGSVAIDPAAALLLGATVAWAELDVPATWGISTAGALLDADGLVVAVHDGVTARGDLMPVVERLRGFEGGLDTTTCGGLADGTYEFATVVQVWEGDVSNVVATYMNPGLGSDPQVRVEAGGAEVALGADDASRRLQSELAVRVDQEGEALTETEVGVRAPMVIGTGARFANVSCLRAASAPRLGGLLVLPSDQDAAEHVFGLVAERAGAAPLEGLESAWDPADAAVWPGVWWPNEGGIQSWGLPAIAATVLLYDAAGDLAAVFEAEPALRTATAGELGYWYVAATTDPGCAAPAELPTARGMYTPVFVSSGEQVLVDGEATGMAPDLWHRLPAFDYDGDPSSLAWELTPDDGP